jgi:predicted membrane protein
MTTKNFRGGKIAVVLGEVDMDLTGAEIVGDQVVIHADAVFGAQKIRVPDSWQVIVRGNTVFGEFSDKTYQRPSTATGVKSLIVKGAAVFGSVVVRN